MGKFDRFKNKKVKISVGGEELEVFFKVEDRLELATIHECRDQTKQYKLLIEFCTNLLKRSYPDDEVSGFEGFLSVNLEAFLEEVMCATNLSTKELFDQKRGDFRKKEENDKGGVPPVAVQATQ